jgi:hypothetical protein
MSFKEFIEMTLSYGEMPDLPFPDFSDATHVGDIEQHKIIKKNNYYAITVNNNPVAYLQLNTKEINNQIFDELNIIYTTPEFRGQNLMKKLVFFLKNSLQKSIMFGREQSKAGQGFIRSLSNSGRFPMYWLNVKTGEKQPYNSTEDHFSLKPYRSVSEYTDWRIIIETVSNPLPQFIPEDFHGTEWYLRYIKWFD